MTDPTNDVSTRKLRRQMEAEARFYHGLAAVLDNALSAMDPALPEEQQAAALVAAREKLEVIKAAFGPGPEAP